VETTDKTSDKKKEGDDDIEIDFSKIKNWFSKKGKTSEDLKVEAKESTEKKETISSPNRDLSTKDTPTEIEKSKQEKTAAKDDDDIVIDFSKVTSFFKGSDKPKTEVKAGSGDVKKQNVESKESDDEISIDFSSIRNKLKNAFKGEESKEKGEDDINVDWSRVGNFFKTYGIFLLALIPIMLSIHVRMGAAGLPITDQWAQDSVINSIKSQIAGQIAQQYPNLPEANRNALVDAELQKQLTQHWPQIQQQIEATSNYFKQHFQDPNGIPYMPDIDTYYWMRYAENILDHGYAGDEIRNGQQWDTYQLAPIGRAVFPDTWPSYFAAYFHSFLTAFNSQLTLVQTMSLYPVFISAIATLLVFLIALKVSNSLGATFAAVMFAINTSYLGRSLYGHADNDAWVLFFPLLITWLFFEMLERETTWKVAVLGGLAGLILGVFTFAWAGGWWFIFDLMMGMAAVSLVYFAFRNRERIMKEKWQILKWNEARNIIIGPLAFVIVGAIAVTIFLNFNAFLNVVLGPLSFTTIKDPVTPSLWPNVLTTVAELNTGSFNQAMNSVGGKFMFYVGVLGILLALLKQNKEGRRDVKSAILLALWFVATCYATLKGIRFTLLLAPAFAVAFGTAIGMLYALFSKWLSKELHVHKSISAVLLIILFMILLINPIQNAYAMARNDLPIVNDVWYNSLIAIKNNSSQDAILTSWWDFGHHFKQIAKRPVTFDGTTQTFTPSYWTGKLLMTQEHHALGILRMLDCSGGDAAVYTLKEDRPLQQAIDITNDAISTDKASALELLRNEKVSEDNAQQTIALTHCEPPEGFVIASNDMIGKSGVWGHFGSWNFERADIWYNVRPMPLEGAVSYLMATYNYTSEQAENTYYEVRAIPTEEEGNRWVAPWPGYAGSSSCTRQGNDLTFTCENGLLFNYTANEVRAFSQGSLVKPKTVAITTRDGMNIIQNSGNTIDMGITLIPENTQTFTAIISSPELAGGMFTVMYYLNGHGLEYFQPFYSERGLIGTEVKIYKADWDGGQKHIEQKYVNVLDQLDNLTAD